MTGKGSAKRISRRRFLGQSVALGSGLLGAGVWGRRVQAQRVEPKDRIRRGAGAADFGSGKVKTPNIVYFFTDQHRADTLGAVGHPLVDTPHLDSVAAQGVVFGRCFSNGPLCRPGRTSMMTGLYPHDHGVWHNFAVAPSHSKSHVRRLRDEGGFHTAVIGKTHLHKGEGHLDDHRRVLEEWGFDDVHELTGANQSISIESGYSDWLTQTTPRGKVDKYERFKDYVDNAVLRYYYNPWDLPPPDAAPWLLQTEDHLDTYTGRMGAEWIRNYRGDRPFYLQVNFPGPHAIFDATSEFLNRYPLADSRYPEGITAFPTRPLSRVIRNSVEFQDITDITPEQRHRLQRAYFAKLSLIDAAIGRVLEALKESGHDETTWIVYGSDHGEMLGDHGLIQKSVFFDASVRVPCILRPPGGIVPWQSSALVEQRDVTATLLEIGGVEPESDQGVSLLDKISMGPLGPTSQQGRDWVLSENYRHGMLRTDRMKLVMNYRVSRPVELYDLERDPKEENNVVHHPDYRGVRDGMVEQMYRIVPRRVWGQRRGRRRWRR